MPANPMVEKQEEDQHGREFAPVEAEVQVNIGMENNQRDSG
jgi:hypothetical protein